MKFIDALLGISESRGEEAAKAFNDYQKWFEKLDRTDEKIDANLGGVRIRCFGNEKEKQETWDREWRSKVIRGSDGEVLPESPSNWGPPAAGVSVSSDIPEIWCDLRRDASGKLILPVHVIGHELMHTLKLKNDKVADPDTLIDKKTYQRK